MFTVVKHAYLLLIWFQFLFRSSQIIFIKLSHSLGIKDNLRLKSIYSKYLKSAKQKKIHNLQCQTKNVSSNHLLKCKRNCNTVQRRLPIFTHPPWSLFDFFICHSFGGGLCVVFFYLCCFCSRAQHFFLLLSFFLHMSPPPTVVAFFRLFA